VTHFARQQEKLFAEHINQRNSFETRKELTRLQRELDNMKRRDFGVYNFIQKTL
jgi:hypothetical protein